MLRITYSEHDKQYHRKDSTRPVSFIADFLPDLAWSSQAENGLFLPVERYILPTRFLVGGVPPIKEGQT